MKEDFIDRNTLAEDERIDAYLKGKMAPEEELLFLKELNANSALKEKAVVTARLVKGLKQVNRSRDEAIKEAFRSVSLDEVETAAAMRVYEDDLLLADRKPNLSYFSLEKSEMPVMESRMEMEPHKNSIKLSKEDEKKSKKGETSKKKKVVKKKISPKEKNNILQQLSDLVKKKGKALIGSAMADSVSSYKQKTKDNDESIKKLDDLFQDIQNGHNIKDAIKQLTPHWEQAIYGIPSPISPQAAEIGLNLAIAHIKNNDKNSAKQVLENLISITKEGSTINSKAKTLLQYLEKQ